MKITVLAALALSMIVTLDAHLPGSCTGLTPQSLGPSDFVESIEVGGTKRTFLVHLPPARSSASALKYPLMVLLHGGNGTSMSMANKTKMNNVADTNNFIVVYPQGLDRSWHWGPVLEQGSFDKSTADDVGFVSKMMDFMANTFNSDPKRVYVGGFSEGGFMTQRLTYQIPNKITAAAIVSASLPKVLRAEVGPFQAPLPVMFILGTEDPQMPYNGGTNSQGVQVYPGQWTVDQWVASNSCNPVPTITKLLDQYPPGVYPELLTYSSPNYKTDVHFYEIVNGGHEWPGGAPALYKNTGNPCNDFSASKAFWDFASRFSK